MGFYIIKQDDEIEGSASIDELPDDMDALEWMQGKRMPTPKSEIILNLSLESGDYRGHMITGLSTLFHQQLKEELDDFGVDNIMYFPVRLLDQNTNTTEGSYFLTNIIGLLDCVDKDKSDLKMCETGLGYDFLSMVIDEKKTNGAKIFRLKDDPTKIIINQELYDHFISTDMLVGVELIKTEDYSDW